MFKVIYGATYMKMIEALIRDDTRLICVITIQPAPEKDSLNLDIFIPSKGQTLSGVMPAGGEPAVQVARAIMTIFPVSALPKPADPELRPASERMADHLPLSGTEEVWAEIDKKMAEIDKRADKLANDIEDLRESQPEDDDETQPLSPETIEELSKGSFPEQWRLVERRIGSLDKREVEFIEREKSLLEREQKLANRKINEEIDNRISAGEGLPVQDWPTSVEKRIQELQKSLREKELEQPPKADNSKCP